MSPTFVALVLRGLQARVLLAQQHDLRLERPARESAGAASARAGATAARSGGRRCAHRLHHLEPDALGGRACSPLCRAMTPTPVAARGEQPLAEAPAEPDDALARLRLARDRADLDPAPLLLVPARALELELDGRGLVQPPGDRGAVEAGAPPRAPRGARPGSAAGSSAPGSARARRRRPVAGRRGCRSCRCPSRRRTAGGRAARHVAVTADTDWPTEETQLPADTTTRSRCRRRRR